MVIQVQFKRIQTFFFEQLRLDFVYFELEQPSTLRQPYAYCAGDRLSIKGLNFDLCGRMVNQHGKIRQMTLILIVDTTLKTLNISNSLRSI